MSPYTSSSIMQQETKTELVDKLLLYVRTDNFDAFFSACRRGMIRYGDKNFANIMHFEFMSKLITCEGIDTFIRWGEKL